MISIFDMGTGSLEKQLTDVSFLNEVRKYYTAFLNEQKITSEIFAQPQYEKKPNDPIDETLLASVAIMKAYPVSEFNPDGTPKDNREQSYIDALNNFALEMQERDPRLITKEEKTLYTAIRVYGSLASMENSIPRMHKQIDYCIQHGITKDDDIKDMLGRSVNEYLSYCNELKEALDETLVSLSKTSDKKSIFTQMIEKLEHFIHKVEKKFGKTATDLPKKESTLEHEEHKPHH